MVGWLTATIFDFLVDLVAGISSDGTFSWGWVILSLISTIASIFGVGLLAKIPGLAKYLKLIIPWLDDLERMIPGLAKLTVWFDDPGKWIWKNDDRIKEILQGKWGTWAKEVLTKVIPRIKQWLPKWLQDLPAKKGFIEWVKHLLNLAWDTVTKGLAGTVEFILKRLIKDTPLPLEKLRQLLTLDSLRDIAQLISEKWQDLTKWIQDQLQGGRTASKP
jgi:hypothetical protein